MTVSLWLKKMPRTQMIDEEPDQHPIVVAIAGSNGSGKSTFYATYLRRTNLPFINADEIASDHGIDAYTAAELASSLRNSFVQRRESFIFETVLSDPKGAKVAFLKSAIDAGFRVVFCFIAIRDAETSEQRVSMRVSHGQLATKPEQLPNWLHHLSQLSNDA